MGNHACTCRRASCTFMCTRAHYSADLRTTHTRTHDAYFPTALPALTQVCGTPTLRASHQAPRPFLSGLLEGRVDLTHSWTLFLSLLRTHTRTYTRTHTHTHTHTHAHTHLQVVLEARVLTSKIKRFIGETMAVGDEFEIDKNFTNDNVRVSVCIC